MAPLNRSALIFIHDRYGSPGDWSPFQTQLRSHPDLFPVRYLTPDAPAGSYLDGREPFLKAGADVRAEVQAQHNRGIPLAQIGVVGYGAAAGTLVLGLAAAGELAGVGAVYAVSAGPLPGFLVEALQQQTQANSDSAVGRLAQYHGSDDTVVSLDTARQTEEILRAAQVPAYELVIVDGGRHAMSGTVISKIIDELPSVFGVQS